jgi:hypothetical protein
MLASLCLLGLLWGGEFVLIGSVGITALKPTCDKRRH